MNIDLVYYFVFRNTSGVVCAQDLTEDAYTALRIKPGYHVGSSANLVTEINVVFDGMLPFEIVVDYAWRAYNDAAGLGGLRGARVVHSDKSGGPDDPAGEGGLVQKELSWY